MEGWRGGEGAAAAAAVRAAARDGDGATCGASRRSPLPSRAGRAEWEREGRPREPPLPPPSSAGPLPPPARAAALRDGRGPRALPEAGWVGGAPEVKTRCARGGRGKA